MRTLLLFIFIAIGYTCLAQDCPVGDLEFTSQAKVDSFPLLYPDCQCVNGSLRIQSSATSPIFNIDSLNAIHRIKGSLVIRDNLVLADLEGLNNVDSIYGDLYFRSNFSLVNIKALDNLRYVGSSFIFRDNLKLRSFQGLEHIDSIKGVFDITNNDELKNFDGLQNVEIITGFFQVDKNDKLENFEGLNRVKSAGGNFHVKSNPKLESFKGFDSLEVIGYNIQLADNTLLQNFEGMDRLVKLEGGINLFAGNIKNFEGLEQVDSIFDIYIVNQPHFTSFEALENLVYTGSLSLANVDSLETLKGFENITHIDGYLRFRFNEMLRDLTALSNVESIDGDLWVDDNAALESLKGLENIDPYTINEDVFAEIPDLIIRNNLNLSDCIYKNICEFINFDLGDYDIKNNGLPCFYSEVISESCMLLSNEPKKIIDMKIYPNPFVNTFSIDISESDILHIYDMQGKIIKKRKLKKGANLLSLDQEESGMYILKTMDSGKHKILKL